MDNVKLQIAKNHFFDNADLLLPAIKDSVGNPLEPQISTWLSKTYQLTPIVRTERGVTRTGYDATELNKVLRDEMVAISGIHGETCVEYGAFISRGKEGFDFALFDEEYNIVKLRNSFVGTPGRFGGESELSGLHKRVIKPSGGSYKKRDWKAKLDSLGGTLGKNIEAKKARYSIAGEIQFGNWALAEHDLLRLMSSATNGEIDYYIYITATGELERRLSSGIVSFAKVVNLFQNNKQLFRTPVWVIGIDIDNT